MTSNRLVCPVGQPRKMTTLLVATGSPWNNARKTKAITVGKAWTRCQKTYPDFPLAIVRTTYGVLYDMKGRPILLVCGGKDQHGQVRDECYYYNAEVSNNWVQARDKLLEKRQNAAGIVIDNGKTLWVTGGWQDRKRLRSTSLVTILDAQQGSFSVQPGPPLPLGVDQHCLVKLNSTTAMLIGGYNGNSLTSTYYLDIPSETTRTTSRSIQGPSLSIGRDSFSCGVLDHPEDRNGQVVFAVGGRDSREGRSFSSVERLVVGSNQWIRGPDIYQGEKIQSAAGVTSHDGKTFLLAGGWTSNGYSSSIYKLDYSFDSSEWRWSPVEAELEVSRREHVAMLVPDSFCSGDSSEEN